MARITEYSFWLENCKSLGQIAAKEGKSRNDCPWTYMLEREAWLKGFDSIKPMAIKRGL